MQRRRTIALATAQALTAAMCFAGAASAEPKNQWPFTRPADPRILAQAVRSGALSTPPRGEPKNETPFTRPVYHANPAPVLIRIPASTGFNWGDFGVGFAGAGGLFGITFAGVRLVPRARRRYA